MKGDVRDDIKLREAVEAFAPTHLVHLAARTDMDGSDLDAYSTNTTGVECVVGVAAQVKELGRCVFASSRLVTPVGYTPSGPLDVRPDSWYGESKVRGEKVVRAHARGSWVIVRPTSIWGPWFGVPYRQFFDSVRSGRYVHPRGAKVMKTFGYVGNATDQIDRITFDSSAQTDGSTLYLGDPPIEVGEFADLIADSANVRRPRRVPIGLLRAVAALGDAGQKVGLFGEAPLTTRRLHNLTTDMVFDLEDLWAVAGKPRVTLRAGVMQTNEWLDHSADPSSRAAAGIAG